MQLFDLKSYANCRLKYKVLIGVGGIIIVSCLVHIADAATQEDRIFIRCLQSQSGVDTDRFATDQRLPFTIGSKVCAQLCIQLKIFLRFQEVIADPEVQSRVHDLIGFDRNFIAGFAEHFFFFFGKMETPGSNSGRYIPRHQPELPLAGTDLKSQVEAGTPGIGHAANITVEYFGISAQACFSILFMLKPVQLLRITEGKGIIASRDRLQLTVIKRAIRLYIIKCVGDIICGKTDEGDTDHTFLIFQFHGQCTEIILRYTTKIFGMHQAQFSIMLHIGQSGRVPVSGIYITRGGRLRTTHAQSPSTYTNIQVFIHINTRLCIKV
ncbi:hypothetical protein D3C86_1129880 [compost metagenome]